MGINEKLECDISVNVAKVFYNADNVLKQLDIEIWDVLALDHLAPYNIQRLFVRFQRSLPYFQKLCLGHHRSFCQVGRGRFDPCRVFVWWQGRGDLACQRMQPELKVAHT